MISRIVGTLFKKNTRTRIWWLKLALALVLSNVFFFTLFSAPAPPVPERPVRQGLVEVQIKAELMTPFQAGKHILLINREVRIHLPAVLEGGFNEEGKLTVWIKEDRAALLFQHQGWEVLPYLPNFRFPLPIKGENHEIRY